ncbi:amylo-alpha-1,6-glucosidase [Roseomonas sp. NAR14]|uniref:Amylo-alpha-1,6-glucosidase n=1 Tax=Roseomonas acroporae TaxID=2937791 RepID=A0A9X2BSK9_9PROT|nr:glycogen debranching N-terminal domain-containing protein [Roseomonas acroporae]MCK8783688.1 amylo-alpha-1,6-glucosidase [Roseomonas acroporae]
MAAAQAESAEESFTIAATAATALAIARPRTLKSGNTFVVLDLFGDAQWHAATAEGLFHEDTRYLSRIALRINGERPLLLSSMVSEDNALLSIDLTNPDFGQRGQLQMMRDTVHLQRSFVCGDGVLHQRLTLRNFGAEPIEFELHLEQAADFADLFEVRGMHRPERGTLLPPETLPDGVLLGYRGLDGVTRRSRLSFAPPPDEAQGTEVRYRLRLAPAEERVIDIACRCEREGAPPPRDLGLDGWLATHQEWTARRRDEVVDIYTANESFNDWINRSRADLDMLATRAPEGPFPYAGIPWFSTAFGRDSLITALQCLWLDPTLASAVLRYLAARQATRLDPALDAEPGKILHETRKGEMAALGEVPFGLYYGSVDATPLFVVLLDAYHARTGDLALVRALWPNVEAALGWMECHGDPDGDGFLTYDRRASNGLLNQGWKDSHDAVFHADGRLAEAPIALAEVQAYAYGAWNGAARLARLLGDAPRAGALERRAARLRERFEARFWCEELGLYALAIDGSGQPCRVRASNGGHTLLTGIAGPERAARMAATMLEPSFFCGWGVRTVAEGESRYNPMSYHNGSVWPHDNGLIAMGLARYGLHGPMLRLLGGMFDSAIWTEAKRLPELFCGFPRRPGEGPTAYPVACLPQAWASATAFAALGAMLGIGFRPEARQIRFERSVLPQWLEWVRLKNLRLGDASVDVLLRRFHPSGVSVSVLRREGDVEVAVIT